MGVSRDCPIFGYKIISATGKITTEMLRCLLGLYMYRRHSRYIPDILLVDTKRTIPLTQSQVDLSSSL